ncbi:hypothetical protein [Nonlabens sp.]|mgnify:CR=1 FL=1|uniref:hypothetical protein n=1 Tax=Nonlabens sp. TaxID=1888209 RepID=UPI003F696221
MKIRLFLTSILTLASWSSLAQFDRGYDLEQFNLFIIPPHEINVKLSFKSEHLRNDPRAFSATPGRESIDMMKIYRESQSLEHKEYTPHIVAHFENKRQERKQQTRLSRPASLSIQNPYYSNTNFAWQQMRRQSYFNQLYRPIYRY